MPRKNKRLRDDPPPRGLGLSTNAPDWAAAPGYQVRMVTGQKAYRCPGCDHEVRAGVQHLVVVPVDPDERRHWHTECWRRELRRLGI